MSNVFDTYYHELSEAYDKNELFFSNNTDRLHNAAIMLLMLEHGSKISMFCGSMSIFCNDFYKKVDEIEQGAGDVVKKKISDAFINFVGKDGNSIDIVIERYNDRIFDDLIFGRDFLKNSTVRLYEVPEYIKNRSEIGHFSFTGDQRIVRVETDADNHEAICKIGNSSAVVSPENSFNTLLKISRRINIAS